MNSSGTTPLALWSPAPLDYGNGSLAASDDLDPYWVERLTRFYAKYNPEKIGGVPAL